MSVDYYFFEKAKERLAEIIKQQKMFIDEYDNHYLIHDLANLMKFNYNNMRMMNTIIENREITQTFKSDSIVLDTSTENEDGNEDSQMFKGFL